MKHDNFLDRVERRPWGFFSVVYADSTTWTKILTVFPRQSLSLQAHEYRTEVWMPMEHGLVAQIGDETLDLLPFERYTVPIRTRHRILNPTHHVCHVIEYATGWVSEDDIERFEDNYGRA